MPTTPNVATFTATDSKNQAVRFTVSTDIVDYMDSAKPFGHTDMDDPTAHGRFQRRMLAIPDRQSNVITPMVLTIGSDNSLYVVRHGDAAHGGGWKLIDLTPSLKKIVGGNVNVQVRAIGAAWNHDDHIAVAVAVDDGTPNAPSRLLVAFDLHSKTTDWDNVPWEDCGTRTPVRVEGIRVLEEADNNWTVVLTGDANNIENLYILRSNMPVKSFARAFVFNPAVSYQEVLDFEVSVDPFIGSGIAVLGTSGGTRVLSFRPFPKYNAIGKITNTPPVVLLPCPDGANVLESGPMRNGGSDLYVGGKGIHLLVANEFDNQQYAKFVEVASANAAPDVLDVIIGDTSDGSAAVWALLRDGGLLFVKRSAGKNEGAWTTPLRLRSEVQAMAPVCGDNHATTSILVVYTDGRAASMWQDAKTGVWNEAPLLVANSGSVAKVTCYGTSLRYLDGDGVPQPGKIVKVSASILANVILNGKTVFIGPSLQAEATTDANGSINLYDRVRSLTPAIYRFTMDDIDDSVDVNPAASTHQRFKEIKADELRNATVPKDGGGIEPLLNPTFAAGGQNALQVDGVAAALNHVSTLATSTSGAVALGVFKVRTGSKFSSTLQNSSLPQDFKVGIKSTASGVQMLDSVAIASLVNSTNSVEKFFSDLGDTIVDFFEGLAHRIVEGWEFVIHKLEDGFRFICKIGDQIKHFAINTLEQVGGFFTWLWQQVKTGVEKIWNYVKFVFAWDDILIARDMMVKATDEALTYLQNSVDTLKQNVDSGFDQTINIIRQWQTDIGSPPAELPKPSAGSSVSDRLRSSTDSQQSLHDQISGNSVIGWVTQKIGTILDEIVHIEGADPSEVAIKAASDFVEGLVGDEIDNLIKTWNQIQADVLKIFDNKLPSNDSLSFETIKNLIVMVGADAVIGLLDGIRALVKRSLDLMVSMIEVVRAAIFAKISFPFIEQLVELVLPGAHLDTSFRLIDAIMLLVAVPSTIAYKLIFNKAPFKKGDTLNLPFGRVAVQSTAENIFSYIELAGGFSEVLIAGYLAKKALAKIEPGGTVNKLDISLSLLFGTVGVTSAVFTTINLLSENESNKKKEAANNVSYGVMGLSIGSLVLSAAFASAQWNEAKDASEVSAGFNIPLTAIMVILDTVIFGLLINNYINLKPKGYEAEEAKESFQWIGSVLSKVGTICFSVAEFDPEPSTKSGLCITGAVTKGVSAVSSLGKVITEGVAPAS